jgi:hypothetical protein
MRKIVYFAFLGLLGVFSSCVTQKACSKRFPSVNDTVRITTVRDSIVIRDTTIFIHLPGQTVTDSVPIPCPPPEVGYIPKKAFAETSLAIATAWWEYPFIRLQLVEKDTTIVRRLAGALKESYYWKTMYEKVHITPPPVKYTPKIYLIAFWLWIGVFVAIAGYIGLKIFVFKK